MGKCSYCNNDMLTSDGCIPLKIQYKGHTYNRIKVGDDGDFYEQFYSDKELRCGDCGAKLGNYHHPGCDCERCPVCGLQLISCDCSF